MANFLVLTLLGADRPGLVQELSRVVSAHEANWEASRMARLAGKFAGILRVSVDPERAEALAADLRGLASAGLTVIVDAGAEADGLEDQRAFELEVVGTDRPGIVREIAAALASRGISVVELATDCGPAPMAGGMLFRAKAALRCPAAVGERQLREALEALADELMVDVDLVAPTE